LKASNKYFQISKTVSKSKLNIKLRSLDSFVVSSRSWRAWDCYSIM